MKKLITILFLLNIAYGQNAPFVNTYGTATPNSTLAVKPDGNYGFIPSPQVIITSVSDFPTAVAGVITLVDNTTYLIKGSVDVGTNTIVSGVKNTIVGVDRNNDKLIFQTTGTAITVDGSVTAKTALAFNEITLSCLNGTLLSANTVSVTFVQSTLILKTGGALTNCAFAIRNSGFSNATANGFTFIGTGSIFRVIANVIGNNAGTTFNLGTSVFGSMLFSNNIVTENTGQTFLSGTTASANVTNSALVSSTVFVGVGTFISTITVNDAKWNFNGNVGTINTALSLANGGTAATSASAARVNLGLVIGTDIQPLLVSATNIKTVNGTTLLGSGDLVVSGTDATKLAILNNLSDLNNAATARTNLGLVIGTNVLAPNGSAASLTGLTSGQVTTALGFTPYNATNPNNYISSVPAQTFASLTGKPTTLAGYGITDNVLLTNGNGSALTGLTASQVGLGNVTNESKATMFTSPTFTGSAVLGTPASGTLTNCTFPTLNQNTTGSAATLTTARTINGVSFNGSANITVTAAATTLGVIDLTAQAANIATTTLYAVPATGMYRVSIYISTTQAATTSSTLPSTTITYTDGVSSSVHSTVTTATSALNSLLTGFAQTSYICYAKTGTNIQYQTSGYLSVGASPMQFQLRIRVEAL